MKHASVIGAVAVIALAALVGPQRPARATEPRYKPVDAYVTPVLPNPGTTAAILPPGTYHAVQADGIRLSGLIHLPDVRAYSMPARPPATFPSRQDVLKSNPGLRFVPVQPQPEGQARPSH